MSTAAAKKPRPDDTEGAAAKKGSKGKQAQDAEDVDTAAAQSDQQDAPKTNDSGSPAKAGTKRKHDGSSAAAEALPENAIEQGKVSFMYKPKVTTPGSDVNVTSVDDVQRLYLLLEPQLPSGGLSRLLIVAKKRLPDTHKHERFFAFVEAVDSDPSQLTAGLKEHTYTTKTRGERLQPGAQPAGVATYVIAKGGSRNGVHIAFKLSEPSAPGVVQDMLGIKEEASFVLSAKNPANKGTGRNVPSAGPDPEYSQEQRDEFGGRSWIGLEDRSLLDVAGTELLLIGAKDDPIETGELGAAGELLKEAPAAAAAGADEPSPQETEPTKEAAGTEEADAKEADAKEAEETEG